jgi:hypothetical protein
MQGLILYGKRIKFSFDGNEVYYTACALHVILKNRVAEFIARKV